MAKQVSALSPAKINLFLAVTGVREDGFHNLISVIAPLDFGDQMTVELLEGEGDDELRILGDASAGIDLKDNTILKTAELFRQKVSVDGHFKITLQKEIPHGAGLGGGSSNAATALESMNSLCGGKLTFDEMSVLLSEVGSDCPLFLYKEPVIVRGRGTEVERLDPELLELLRSEYRVLLFKPSFLISTVEIYKRMKVSGAHYISEADACELLDEFMSSLKAGKPAMVNNLQDAAFSKYLFLPVILNEIREKFGQNCIMSGSGSTCFAISNSDSSEGAVIEHLKAVCGDELWLQECRLF